MTTERKLFVCSKIVNSLTTLLTTAVFALLALTTSIQPLNAQQNASATLSTPSAPQDSLPDAPSTAQPVKSNSFGSLVGTAVTTVAKDEVHILKSPFQKKALVWDAVVLGATGALIATDESVAEQVPASWHTDGVHVSDACTYGTAGIAGAIYVTGLVTHNEQAQRTGYRSAESAVDTVLLAGAMKLIFARERPYSNNYEGKFFAGNFSSGSFPSGHSALSWSIATVIAKEYPKLPVQLLMYGLATTVSATRVTAGEHFPSDVFVGSTLGYLIGTYVANKDKHSAEPHPHAGNRLKRLPNAVLAHVALQ